MPENKSNETIKAIPAEDVDRVDGKDKFIPIETIIEYASKGLSLSEIAKLCNCSKQNVHQRLQAVAFNKTDLENFKNHRKDVFAFIQSKLLNSLDEETIKEMNPYQRVISAGVLYDKERLERGQPTEIYDQFTITASLEEIRKRKEELLKEIQIRDVTSDEASNNNQTNTEEIKTHENR